ncbi:MAG: PorT family protein [Bacteroidales bacterium]|nr:PorT family protein [Bacteroidales bacterium]
MKKLVALIAFFASTVLYGQYFESEIAVPLDTNAVVRQEVYLDTVQIKVPPINNYSSIGVSFGVTSTYMQLNPTVFRQHHTYYPGYGSIRYTHYEKMFDYLPYFGWQIGVEFGHEGYRGRKETDRYYKERSQRIKMQVVEVPFLAMIHYDTRWLKFFGEVGLYGGYRLNIERFGDYVDENYRYEWYDSDRRIDYGIQGGFGMGVFLGPVELFAMAQIRYGWSSIFDPDNQYPEGSGHEDLNKYYWRFAYPFDYIFSAGVNIPLGKRYGKTRQDLKREAYEIVYGTDKAKHQ